MNMTEITVVGSSAIIFTCCSFLTLNKEYDDGVFGKAILISMVFGSGITIAYVFECNYEPAQSTVVTLVALALFLLRHSYRFLRWRMDGKFSWTKLRDEIKETL